MSHRSVLVRLILVLSFLPLTAPLGASLILATPDTTSGTGLGAADSFLTISDTPSESGCVAFAGGVDATGPAACPAGFVGGDEQTGGATQTIPVSAVGSAANIRLVLNASEPAGDGIVVDNLQLRIFDTTGAVLFSSGAFAPLVLPYTFSGIGNAGFVFQLDAAQAAAAQAAGFGNPANRIGLAANISQTAGGLETFFFADVSRVAPPSIATIPTLSEWGFVLLAILLAGAAWWMLRRRRAVNA